MSAMSDAELDYLSVQNDEERPPGSLRFLLSQDETRRLIAAVREARAERDALRELIRYATVRVEEDITDYTSTLWHLNRRPIMVADSEATLLRSILDGAG